MSALADTMAFQLRAARLSSGMETEHRFHPKRRWRFDFAWPSRMVALEVEGGTYAGGRHTRGAGYAADIEKYNEAALCGWRVLRADAKQVADGRALNWAARALEHG